MGLRQLYIENSTDHSIRRMGMDQMAEKRIRRKRMKIAALAVLLVGLAVLLAGLAVWSMRDTSLRAYCTESQQDFLDRSQEELPVALVYHHNDNILGRYETTDGEIISGVLQALRETTVANRTNSGSSDQRILEFKTADGNSCLFVFDERRFHGAGGKSYELSGDDKIWELTQEILESDPQYQDIILEYYPHYQDVM